MLTRRAFTIPELLVALTTGGVVLAVFSALSVRQQRLYADLDAAIAGAGQMRQVTALLPIELRAAAPGLGDLVAAAARDTAIQFRAPVATGVVCDVTADGLLLAARLPEPPALASFLTAPVARDTAWVLILHDSTETWRPVPIGAVSWRDGCALAENGAAAVPGRSLFLRTADADHGGVRGSVVRITRPTRFSLYRASDGRWYLGQREWNPANAQFSSIQPVGGPFARPADGGLRITYRRTDGTPLSVPLADASQVALVDVVLRTVPRRLRARIPQAPLVRDSARLVVRLRNP